jgi:hypothetical protein
MHLQNRNLTSKKVHLGTVATCTVYVKINGTIDNGSVVVVHGNWNGILKLARKNVPADKLLVTFIS